MASVTVEQPAHVLHDWPGGVMLESEKTTPSTIGPSASRAPRRPPFAPLPWQGLHKHTDMHKQLLCTWLQEGATNQHHRGRPMRFYRLVNAFRSPWRGCKAHRMLEERCKASRQQSRPEQREACAARDDGEAGEQLHAPQGNSRIPFCKQLHMAILRNTSTRTAPYR